MSEKRERKPLMLRLPVETVQLLEELAAQERRPKVQVVELAIEALHRMMVKS